MTKSELINWVNNYLQNNNCGDLYVHKIDVDNNGMFAKSNYITKLCIRLSLVGEKKTTKFNILSYYTLEELTNDIKKGGKLSCDFNKKNEYPFSKSGTIKIKGLYYEHKL